MIIPSAIKPIIKMSAIGISGAAVFGSLIIIVTPAALPALHAGVDLARIVYVPVCRSEDCIVSVTVLVRLAASKTTGTEDAMLTVLPPIFVYELE